ncbi:hypothetical protein V8C86DRAFT_2844592 [Haematococcus lacustris]
MAWLAGSRAIWTSTIAWQASVTSRLPLALALPRQTGSRSTLMCSVSVVMARPAAASLPYTCFTLLIIMCAWAMHACMAAWCVAKLQSPQPG